MSRFHHPLRVILSVLLALAFLFASANSGQATQMSVDTTVLYAAPEATGAGDCSSWESACTLQTALSTAVAPAEIWVKAGVHKPTTAAGNVTASFTLQIGVALYGGFTGTELNREERNWANNLTILSGDIEGDDLNADGNFIIEDVDEIVGVNTRHILIGDHVDETSILDGFVITAGSALGYAGAGIYLANGSKPLLENLTIIGNEASSGGGLLAGDSGPTILNSGFFYNLADYRGGAIYDDLNIGFNLINCSFIGNVTPNQHGAAILTAYSRSSGGILKIVNATFSQNYTGYSVAGIFADNANVQLTNVTFSDNTSVAGDPAVIYSYQSSWTLSNVVMWGNHSPGNVEFQRDTYSPITIYNSDIAGCGASGASWNVPYCGTDGGGNVQVDPQFVNPALGNFRLGQSSPLIDAGNNDSVPAGITTDLAGNPRFVDMPLVTDTGIGTAPIVDMGAYETYEDTSSPEVESITRLDASPTNANEVGYLVTFSEPVLGLDVDDFVVSAPAITGVAVTRLVGSGVEYLVDVSTGTGSGWLRLDLAVSATIEDLMGNHLSALPYDEGEVYIIDREAPGVVSITRQDPTPTNAGEVHYQVAFTEPIQGLDASDFGVSGPNIMLGSVSEITGGAGVYMVTVNTGTGSGWLRLDLRYDATITDVAGNAVTDLPYELGEVYDIDKIAPEVVSITRLDDNPTDLAEVRFSLVFSEDVILTDYENLTVTGSGGNTGAYVVHIGGSGASYTVRINTGTGGGSVRLDIPSDANILDLALNQLAGLPYEDGESYRVLYYHTFLPTVLR